ncbi:WD40/YVTN/BNR-like repeat-containing protein [Taibaiella helva]|uniref:WD40/YVTN/BNR-like repeat-containing protein n=1 Tax=Taibaiella helva TaxID=2301235 RepID=UPI000E56BE00|nr:hypothetical protein [Taibaiella helva]
MQKGFLPSVLLASAVALVTLQGCKKDNGIGVDNDKVVKTPYSLYVADDKGWLVNSSDGTTFSSIFPPDGFAPNLILTSRTNLLMLKQNLHLSANNGKNFNPVFSDVKHFPWQTMAYDFPGQNTVFICSNTERGISISKDNGKTWQEDRAWEDNPPPVFNISSFSGLGNNAVFAYSNLNNLMFRKDAPDANWRTVVMEGDFLRTEGTEFFLTSNPNTLFLTDYLGRGGVWYSSNEGLNWTRIGQGALPFFHHWNCALSPDGGNSLLVGTDTMGVYRVENGSFVSATVGLEKNTSVYRMALKKNIYKNDAVRSYVFIATNKGVYRSEDSGRTWDKMTFGSFDASYKAAY